MILDQIEGWEKESIVSAEQAETLRARYKQQAEAEPDGATHFGIHILHALGGLVFGSAVVAFVIFLDVDFEIIAWMLAVLGLILLTAGVLLARQGSDFGDPLSAASLIPISVLSGAGSINPIHPIIAVGAPLAVLVLRMDSRYLQPLAAIAFSIATFVAIEEADGSPWIWLGVTLLASTASPLPIRLLERRIWPAAWHVVAAIFVITVAFAAMTTFFETDMDWGEGGAQIFIGIFMIAGLGGGILLRQYGLILGAAIALAVDAIVFAFVVGGLISGTITLLLVAGGLIAFAKTFAKRILR